MVEVPCRLWQNIDPNKNQHSSWDFALSLLFKIVQLCLIDFATNQYLSGEYCYQRKALLKFVNTRSTLNKSWTSSCLHAWRWCSHKGSRALFLVAHLENVLQSFRLFQPIYSNWMQHYFTNDFSRWPQRFCLIFTLKKNDYVLSKCPCKKTIYSIFRAIWEKIETTLGQLESTL